jgi:hypothetical protein
MKLVTNKIKPREEKIREIKPIIKIPKQIYGFQAPTKVEFVDRVLPKPRPKYHVNMIEQNKFITFEIVDYINDIIKETTTVKITNKDSKLAELMVSYPKLLINDYKRINNVEISIEEKIKIKKESQTYKGIPTPTSFLEWSKNKLEEFIGYMDDYRISVDYSFKTTSDKQLILDITSKGGRLKIGNHRIIMNYNKKEYTYFYANQLKYKSNNLKEFFE